MSLVSEALRKARQEAAERGEKQRGMTFRTTVTLGGGRTSRRPGWVIALVVLAALGGAAAAWLVLSPGSAARPSAPRLAQADAPPSAPQSASSAASAPSPTPTSSPASASAAGAQPASTPASPATLAPVADVSSWPVTQPRRETASPAAPRARATRAPAPARPHATVAPPFPSGPGAVTVVPVAAPPTAPAPPRATARPARAPGPERTFVLEADIGGTKLHLDFIVSRSQNPFARINGEQVVIGSVLAGYTVEEIAPEFVRLAGPAGIVVIRTH